MSEVSENDPKSIRRAPSKKLRICYVDARDGWPTPERDVSTTDQVRQFLGSLLSVTAECMITYDDQGEVVEVKY